jgi:hypothetical protein
MNLGGTSTTESNTSQPNRRGWEKVKSLIISHAERRSSDNVTITIDEHYSRPETIRFSHLRTILTYPIEIHQDVPKATKTDGPWTAVVLVQGNPLSHLEERPQPRRPPSSAPYGLSDVRAEASRCILYPSFHAAQWLCLYLQPCILHHHQHHVPRVQTRFRIMTCLAGAQSLAVAGNN